VTSQYQAYELGGGVIADLAPVPFSDTGAGSGADITPDFGAETFTVNANGTYQIDWSVNVSTFSGADFRLALVVTRAATPSVVSGSTVVAIIPGVVVGQANVELLIGDVVTLISVTGDGEDFTLVGSPSTGATISFTRVN
jgi:hypothetical protein